MSESIPVLTIRSARGAGITSGRTLEAALVLDRALMGGTGAAPEGAAIARNTGVAELCTSQAR